MQARASSTKFSFHEVTPATAARLYRQPSSSGGQPAVSGTRRGAWTGLRQLGLTAGDQAGGEGSRKVPDAVRHGPRVSVAKPYTHPPLLHMHDFLATPSAYSLSHFGSSSLPFLQASPPLRPRSSPNFQGYLPRGPKNSLRLVTPLSPAHTPASYENTRTGGLKIFSSDKYQSHTRYFSTSRLHQIPAADLGLRTSGHGKEKKEH